MSSKPRSTESSKSRRESAAKAKAPAHVPFDIAGVLFFALAALTFVGLIYPDAGLVGGFIRELFAAICGKGSWGIPFALCVLGLGFIRGRSSTHNSGFVLGVILIFFAVIGLIARDTAGDYFDPVTAKSSGGYLGAVLAWGFGSLFGAGRVVATVTLGLVGFVLCANKPIFDILKTLRERSTMPIREASEAAGKENPKELEKPKKQLIINGEKQDVRDKALPKGYVDVDPEPSEEDIKKNAKKAPIIRDSNAPDPKQPLLSTEVSIPKEGYQLPPVNLLTPPPEKAKRSPQEMQKNIETIEGTLEQFGIDANVVEVATGPTITRYEIQLGPGVRVARIVSLADNIAMDMAASMVRVEAPIPGKAAIGLEIPNVTASMVTIRELTEDKAFLDHPSRLYVALGKDVSGLNRYADLTKMPHLLIAGATNSGKSIGLATLITSLLMRNTPKDVRLVMIDPKRVELTLFDQIPHLMCPVIKDVKEAPGVLRAIIREMDRRYDLLSENGMRNIDGWNAKASYQDRMSYIVVIIDELADLMIQAKAEVESSIVRIAQLARAVGIHLVIATQRPSVDVITGTIKANIPSRIAFSVASQIDSRTILDGKGAEALIGRGDMLYAPIDANKPIRIQGCYVSEKEIDQICNFWRQQETPNYVFDPAEFEPADAKKEAGDFGEDTGDPLWEEVVRFVVERGQASTSMVQRKFSVGFQRASRLIDMMEERGIVGAKDGSKPREALWSIAELENSLGGANRYDLTGNLDDFGDSEVL